MTKVHCSVTNCSYNNDRVCYAQRVAIGGQGAVEDEATCCGTFLNQDVYSNLAEHTEYKSPCLSVTCSVATCTYHADHQCTLNSIDVDGSGHAAIYIETCCSSFKPQ
ncbi:MAG: DUF1540 domain-containing protein [Zhenhengia sp.]|jgi:hypothetical protein|uniref:DUF1540 domain-containing protein n=1 Tax=Zhenhengia yiwuensis TaxID=2763666 RepID=A0A926IFT4_9FIRM|nr:DUF1540 domain-containing protein [Zhenhengia yiwuensis]MBC8580881.1 DUF1540 domain-containing protein [Zhenhengia yiwuensis]MBS5798972.1 DUF1540 domain-containing protein [Clostridiales bacterium]MDU6359200.1 DUF1540 domain-containing protein [Clostridiales bacterium]